MLKYQARKLHRAFMSLSWGKICVYFYLYVLNTPSLLYLPPQTNQPETNKQKQTNKEKKRKQTSNENKIPILELH